MNQSNRVAVFGGIIAAGVIVAIAAIFISTRNASGGGARFDYDSIPQSVTDDGAPVLGNPDAPITIVEFADFMCGHCQEYTSVIDQLIEEKVVTGEAKFEFRMFPSVDRNAITFRLVECATEQDPGIFWTAHDVMFDLTKRGWNQNSSTEFANRLNLNSGEMFNCISEADQWTVDATLGQQNGISGTPGIRIRLNDGELEPISGFDRGGPSYSVLETTIDAANRQ